MRRTPSKSIAVTFLFDCAVLSFISSYIAKNIFGGFVPDYIILISVFLILFFGLFILFLKGNYKIREFNISVKNTYLLLEGLILAHIPAGILLYFLSPKTSALKFIFLNIVVTFIVLELYRILFHIYLFNIKRTKNVLIIGSGRNAKMIADEIINKKALKMNVCGFIDDNSPSEEKIEDNRYKIYIRPYSIKDIIEKNEVDIVIMAVAGRMSEDFLTELVFAIPDDVYVYKLPQFYEMITGKYFIEKSSVNLLFYDYIEGRSIAYKIFKRMFDIASAVIILVLAFPILVYIAVRVKLTDGGSPLYVQTRIGRGGKPFKMYKLRTMYINDYVPKAGNIADTGNQDKDSRVIPFCKFVRKARFDEIPQMINIIKGDMSIVGPRTEWEDLVKIYSNEIPYYKCRQWVKTGWTGWAQINQGHCVLNDDIAEKLQYDLYYLKNRNIAWELCILVKAVSMALSGRHG